MTFDKNDDVPSPGGRKLEQCLMIFTMYFKQSSSLVAIARKSFVNEFAVFYQSFCAVKSKQCSRGAVVPGAFRVCFALFFYGLFAKLMLSELDVFCKTIHFLQ